MVQLPVAQPPLELDPGHALTEDEAEALRTAVGAEEHRRGTFERLEKLLGTRWPVEGPLGEYAGAVSLTTDAHPVYHLAGVLPLFCHELTALGIRPSRDVGKFFRVQSLLCGRSASSKSTAIKRALDFWEEYRVKAHDSAAHQVVLYEGTQQGMFEAMVDANIDNRVHALVLQHDEVSNVLSKKRQADSQQEVLCRFFDSSQPLERHQRGIKRHNRTSAVKEIERITTYACSAMFATTQTGLAQIATPMLLSGGLFNRFIWALAPDIEITHSVRAYIERYRAETVAAIDVWLDWRAWLEAERIVRLSQSSEPWITVECPEALDRLLVPTLLKDLRAELDDVMASFLKRALVQARQLASLFAINDRRFVVNEDDMLMAIAFMEMTRAGFEEVYAGLLAIIPPTFAESVRRIAGAIQRAGQTGLLRRDLYAIVPYIRKRELDEIVERLLDEDRITTLSGVGSQRYVWKR